jgi:dimethylhistidine N-methyltransferase
MTTIALPQIPLRIAEETETPVAAAVREGLAAGPKRLPAWLFYDAEGSRLFDQITQLPEYYLTRTERGIFSAHAGDIVDRAAQYDPGATDPDATYEDKPARLRIAELGAGSADKTRLLLRTAAARQGTLLYEPVDVSSSALQTARERIEGEIPGVHVLPRVMDYTRGLDLYPAAHGERRLVLYIGSSIGNFEPQQASEVLEIIRAGLEPGDALLLGVDLRKDESTLLAAYDDAAGVTARFNLNLLARLNRELGADFDLESFSHRAVWNPTESRIEMHLESLIDQRVKLPALDLEVEFEAGERIHTENSYKYAPGQAEAMLSAAGFNPESAWTDVRGWFAVCLGRAR